MAISLVGTASADGSSTAVSVTHGLSIAEGDVIVAGVHVNADPTVSDNNGAYAFTADYNRANPISSKYYVYHRVAGASEPSSYAWTLNSSQRWSVVVRVYRGVDTASVWDVAPGAGSSAVGGTNSVPTSPATAPTITIATEGACGIVMVSADKAPTSTTWSDPTNSYGDEQEEAGQQTQATYDRLGLSTGATGTTSVTPSANEAWVAIQCALKPQAMAAKKNTMLMGVG